MNRKLLYGTLAMIIPVLLLPGCGANSTIKGGAAGAGIGGLIGGIIGKQQDNTATGAIVGAAVGGTAGALIGRYMDKQAEEMQAELPDAKVERVGEGIKITLDSAILFGFDSANLETSSKQSIDNLVGILQKYDDTNIIVEGHTDSQGTEQYNQGLSERRAKAVTDYALSKGLAGGRITTVGHGESMPVASNDTEEGRRQNRRVEIGVFANEDLKKAAENGEIPQS